MRARWLKLAARPIIDGDGDRIQPFSVSEFAFVDGPFDTAIWTAENNCGQLDGIMHFEKIGAAYHNVEPHRIQDIIFNGDGTQFCYYTVFGRCFF